MWHKGVSSLANVRGLSSSKLSFAPSQKLGSGKWQSISKTRFFSTSIPSYLLNIPATKVTTLPSQMRVATEETGGETATVGVWIDAGSAYEDEHNNGVAHFLEHMAFKGTSRRTREALEVEIENMGGSLNAYTSREQTVYYAKVFKNDVPKAMDILSDILLNSKLDEANIENERSTILREMEEVNKDESEVIFDYLHSAAFQGTSLARTILGPAENVKKLQRSDLQNYINKFYKAPRMVLSAAGAVKHDEIVSLTQKSFAGLDAAGNIEAYGPTPFTGSAITVADQTMDRAFIALAVESVGWTHPDYFTFMLIQTLLGSWDRSSGAANNMASRLCEALATNKLAHSLNSFNTCFKNTGLFGCYLVTPPDQLDDAVYEVFTEWNRLRNNATPSEIERAKTKLKSSVLMGLDGTTAVAEDIGRQLLTLRRRLTPAEVFLRIDAITVDDVMRVMSNHFEDVSPAISALGDIHALPDYNILRDWTFQRRW